MRNIKNEGIAFRMQIKELVLDFLRSTEECSPEGEGMTQAKIFRECGLDWEDQPKAPSTQQQFWLVALLYVLEKEDLVQRDPVSKKWHLK